MEAQEVTLAIAFIAGVLSFVSPCHLTLVPGYISYISGATVSSSAVDRGRIIAHAVFFVLGFSTVLVLLGASVGLVGYLFYDYLPLVRRVGGLVLIMLGLHLAGIVRISALYREVRLNISLPGRFGYPASFLLGTVFGVGWTPCVGPTLAAILLLAGTSSTWAQGAILLASYSLGLGLPFLLTAAALGTMSEQIKRLNRYGGLISMLSGLLLLGMGLLLFTNRLQQLAGWLGFWVPFSL